MNDGEIDGATERFEKLQLAHTNTETHVARAVFTRCVGDLHDGDSQVLFSRVFLKQPALWRADVLQEVLAIVEAAYWAAREQMRKELTDEIGTQKEG